MRLILYSLRIFIVLLASALFILGYEGTQIREFLIGVAAIIVVPSRIVKPQKEASEPKVVKSEQTDTRRRKRRLSATDEMLEGGSESRDESDSTQSS